MPDLRPHLACLTLALTAALGCGGGSPTAPATATTTSSGSTTTTSPTIATLLATLPGNWQMEIANVVTTPTGGTSVSSIAFFNGALTIQGSAVSGIFRLIGPGSLTASPCIASTQDIPFTGSVDTDNLLTLTSAPFSGSVAVLTLQLPLTPAGSNQVPFAPGPSARGSATLTGGFCSLATSTLFGLSVPPVTGTYTGPVTQAPALGQPTAPGGTASLTLAQVSAANVDGQFPVTGTFHFTSGTCDLTSTLTGVVTGTSLILNQNLLTQTPPLFSFLFGPFATLNSSRFVSFTITTSAPGCAAGNYQGQLALQ